MFLLLFRVVFEVAVVGGILDLWAQLCFIIENEAQMIAKAKPSKIKNHDDVPNLGLLLKVSLKRHQSIQEFLFCVHQSIY